MNPHPFETIALDTSSSQASLVILDQTLLPNEEKYIKLFDAGQVYEAIKSLRVRGAPAIGIAAALGLYVHMANIGVSSTDGFVKEFNKAASYLSSARPTAANLNWALGLMTETFNANKTKPIDELLICLRQLAEKIKADDEKVCRLIGEYGASLVSPGVGILTHCNAGALAASHYGTALAPMYILHEKGIKFRVFADETRPLLQGARLTSYELVAAGIDVTLICDNMAAHVMQKGLVDAVFVGCDRVAANGDAANKIGTCGVAILANAFSIPFYICAPFSTIDPKTPTGADIVIEERETNEVTSMWYKKSMAPDGAKVYNPAFDVTSAKYITAFITERGIIYPPYDYK